MSRVLILLLVALSACVDNVSEYEPKTKSANEAISIVNDAKNTTLYINGCNLGDIPPIVVEYNDTIVLCEVEQVDTIVLDGSISSNGFWLYEGLMYAPFGNVVRSLGLCDSVGNKVLHPIGFDASVNDWEL